METIMKKLSFIVSMALLGAVTAGSIFGFVLPLTFGMRFDPDTTHYVGAAIGVMCSLILLYRYSPIR